MSDLGWLQGRGTHRHYWLTRQKSVIALCQLIALKRSLFPSQAQKCRVCERQKGR